MSLIRSPSTERPPPEEGVDAVRKHHSRPYETPKEGVEQIAKDTLIIMCLKCDYAICWGDLDKEKRKGKHTNQ